jgi:hypothetical protein
MTPPELYWRDHALIYLSWQEARAMRGWDAEAVMLPMVRQAHHEG